MKKKDYLKKYTCETNSKNLIDEKIDEVIILSVPNKCYITLKSFVETDKLIDFLAEHEIIKLDSTFKYDNYWKYPVANIGFSEVEQKWYGWSHRAIYGFGIGSKVKKGDCAYIPNNKENYIESCLKFWSTEDDKGIHAENVTNKGFDIVGHFSIKHETFPEKYGNGEWEAKTLEDAKKMAIDFANNIA